MEHQPHCEDIINRMIDRIARGLLLALIFLLVACQDARELPTLMPTVAPFSQPPALGPTPGLVTATPVGPTITEATATAALVPSATPVVQTPQPTLLAGPGVNITSPAADSEIVLGQEVVVSGLVQLGPEQGLVLALVSATGHVLGQAEPEISEFNSWQAALPVPHSVSGRAEILAQLVDQDGQVIASDIVPVMLRVDPDSVDRYLILDRPQQAAEAVAGNNVFFDGLAQNPVDSVVTISIWNESCQNRVAIQSFRLRGSGYWQGFVVIPHTVTGPACAVAHFGEPGNDLWREAQVLIDVLSPDDEQALAVQIGNPPPERVLTPGTSLLLYGTAYNAPEREVLVSILLDNGRLLTEGVAAADIYGYWEIELFIPANAAGPAQIEASVGERGSEQYAQSTVLVHIGQR